MGHHGKLSKDRTALNRLWVFIHHEYAVESKSDDSRHNSEGVFVFVTAAQKLGFTYIEIGAVLSIGVHGVAHYRKNRPTTPEFSDKVQLAVEATLTSADLDLRNYSTAALLREILRREGLKVC